MKIIDIKIYLFIILSLKTNQTFLDHFSPHFAQSKSYCPPLLSWAIYTDLAAGRTELDPAA